MKKVLLWHGIIGLYLNCLIYFREYMTNVTLVQVLLIINMIVACSGYLYFGMKEYKQKVWLTAIILVAMTFATYFITNPLINDIVAEIPAMRLLNLPYGGALAFIQSGLYLAMNEYYFGVIVIRLGLLVPSALVVIGVAIGKYIDKKQKDSADENEEKSSHEKVNGFLRGSLDWIKAFVVNLIVGVFFCGWWLLNEKLKSPADMYVLVACIILMLAYYIFVGMFIKKVKFYKLAIVYVLMIAASYCMKGLVCGLFIGGPNFITYFILSFMSEIVSSTSFILINVIPSALIPLVMVLLGKWIGMRKGKKTRTDE